MFRRIMVYVLVAIVLWLFMGWAIQRRVLFPRHLVRAAAAVDPGLDIEVLWLQTSAGPVEGWFMPGGGVSGDSPGPLVIFAHGNGELIEFWPEDLGGYTRLGVSVLLPEYRGYGRSAGSPSEGAIIDDFTAFYDQVIQRADVDRRRVVFHGRSLGGGVVARMAAQRPPAAMILQSSFTGVPDVARRFLMPRLLIRDRFEVLPVLGSYDAPVLILHGERDTLIRPRHAERLHAAAPRSQLVYYDMGHNGPPPSQQYWQDIERFLRQAEIID